MIENHCEIEGTSSGCTVGRAIIVPIILYISKITIKENASVLSTKE